MNMNLKKIGTVFLLTAGLLGTRNAQAQTTYEEMEQLTVNEQVTTVITASEPVRMVDISTDKVVGDQPLDNIVRLKPKEAGHEDGEVIAIVTVITERYRTQYALVYTTRLKEAVTDKEILPHERNAYNNPAVSMSTAEMTRFARRIWNSPARIRNVATKAHDKVVGDQPLDNIVRLKPKEAGHEDGEVIAIVTVITERYRTQYALVYTTRLKEAVTDKEILPHERNAYNNPAVSMSTAEMTRFARRIWNSPARIRNVATKAHRMVMRLNNIYSVGDYFFIDFSIENKTNIRFDIDEIRVKLVDKKLAKATNAQTIELTPAMILEPGKTFRHGYRNVLVIKKMTFPNDKLLTVEMTEKQISGRNISLNIDYEDVLSADSFNADLLEEE